MLKRDDIIERLAKKGYTKKSARFIIDDFVRVVSEALVEGEEIQFHGFGTFCVKDLAPRETSEVGTGNRIVIPAHREPKFVPGKQLKRWVREGIIRE